jgi:hypothetical protein
MDLDLKQRFLERWEAYFPGAELPIAFYYTDEVGRAAAAEPKGRGCLICELAPVRQGTPLQFDVETAVVVFFAPPDVLSGLFTLAGYDEVNLEAVTAPFSSGCGSIVYHPYQELQSGRPRCVLGMFDVSARPCVPANVLTFAVPWPKLVRMVADMDESFLITGSWRRVQARIRAGS